MSRFPKTKDYPFLGISPYRWYRALVFAEAHMPEALIYFIARRAANGRMLVDKAGKEAVRHNLRIILGPDATEKEIKRLTRGVYYETGAYLAEFMGQRRWAPKWLSGKGWHCEGIEHIESNVSKGRGVLVISAHFSNWEVGAALLAALKYDVFVTSLEHEDPRIDALFNYLRSVWGYHHMPIEQSARMTLDVLKQGKIVTYLGDRPLAKSLTEVDFFGKKVLFPTTPAKMALHTGAAYVPGFVRREGRNFFHLTFFPEIKPLDGADEKENLRHMVQEYAKVLENMVRKYPSQWIRFTKFDEDGRS